MNPPSIFQIVGPMGGIDLWPKHGTEVTPSPPLSYYRLIKAD